MHLSIVFFMFVCIFLMLAKESCLSAEVVSAYLFYVHE